MSEGAYVCTLDEASIKKAKDELNEDPKERAGAVQALRDWINQQKWLKSPTDDLHLLGILRARKFSQLRAREMIETSVKLRTSMPEWYVGNDPSDPKQQKMWEAGVYVPLPKKDKEGRMIMLMKLGNIDPTGASYTPDEFMKASSMIIDYMLMDENAQVNGIIFIGDMSGMTIKHQMFFGMDKTKKSMEVMQKATPARIKGLHYYNTGPVFESFFAIFKLFMSEKLQKRIYLHGQSMVSLYEHIDMSILPDEYLPDDYTGPSAGPLQSIINNFINDMKKPNVQRWIKMMHSPEWGIDVSQKPVDVPQASFRKLNMS